MSMHLLIATGLYPPEIGGPATYAKLFEERLSAFGIEVSVLPFRIVRHLPPLIRHAVYAWKLARMARTADLILVQDTVSTGLPAVLASLFSGKKLVVRVPGDYAWEQGVQRFGVKESLDEFQSTSYGLRVALLRALQRFVVGHAYRVIAPSTYLARIVAGWLKAQKEITVIYNGIAIHPATGVQKQRNTIVSAGRLVPWKGFEEVIDIMSRRPEWQLTIYGDGPLRQTLQERMQKSASRDRMRIETNTSNEALRKVFEETSVFVLNSRYEGMSHTLIEAMAAGCAVVATRVGGNPEVVRDNEDGLLVEPANPRDLERGLMAVMGDTPLRTRLGEAAVQRARDFSIEKTVEATAALLKSCAL